MADKMAIINRRNMVMNAKLTGASNEQISEQLKIPLRTVDRDIANIRDELIENCKIKRDAFIAEYLATMNLITSQLYIQLRTQRIKEKVKKIDKEGKEYEEDIDKLIELQPKEKREILAEIRRTKQEMMKTLSEVGWLPHIPDTAIQVNTAITGTSVISQLKALYDEKKKLKAKEHAEITINP